MAQSEFIDLYELLNVPMESDAATIKKRVGDLYIEAQNNLDHRNAQRRLQYQQLHELYLPQARHLLLDAGRRAEYDRYVTAFRSGKPLAQIAAKPVAAPGGSAPVSDIPEMSQAEEKIDPVVLAAQREQLWDKWKHALDDEEPAAPAAHTNSVARPVAPRAAAPVAAAATPATPAPAAAPIPSPRPAGASPPAAPPARRTNPALKKTQEPDPAELEAEKQRKEEFDRIRETQRIEMTTGLTQTAWLIWTFVGGIGTLVLLGVLLFVLDIVLENMKKYPVLGMARGTFTGVGYAIIMVLALGAAIGIGLWRRGKLEEELGALSFEELQKRARAR